MGTILFDKSAFRYSSVALASNGSTVAALAVRCSQNIEKGLCWGYGEIVAKYSTDGGESWSAEQVLAAPPARKITAQAENTKSAFFLNPVLTATANGGFAAVFTFYPESMGGEEEKLLDKKKTAYTYFNNKLCPLIYDRDGKFFIVRENGDVLNAAKASTGYRMEGMGDLYRDGEYMGNIHLNGAMGKSEVSDQTKFGAPLKAPKRSYLMAMTSPDGINWSTPQDIGGSVITASDGVCSETGCGSAALCDSGRIIVPLTCEKGTYCIYSDDGGVTWMRNRRLPYLPCKGAVSVLQAPGGEVIALGKKSCISYDKGITWLKDKAKLTAVRAICRDGKIVAAVQSKLGTATVRGEAVYKRSKLKGADFESDVAMAGGFLPAIDIAPTGNDFAALYVTPDYTQVTFSALK